MSVVSGRKASFEDRVRHLGARLAREVGADHRYARLYVAPVEAHSQRSARLLTPANYQVGGHVGAGLDGPGITWSPDGASIAFTHSPSPLGDDWVHADVSVVDVQTGAIRPLLNSPAAEGGIVWSPDGKWIAVAISDDCLETSTIRGRDPRGQRMCNLGASNASNRLRL